MMRRYRRLATFCFSSMPTLLFWTENWAASYFSRFDDPRVAAVSFVPRAGEPAIFALLCRVESYRASSSPALACRYEFPEIWPNGVNPQPGDVAARELAKAGKIIVNIGEEESLRHVVNFRSTTGVRSSREQVTSGGGNSIFWKMVSMFPELSPLPTRT